MAKKRLIIMMSVCLCSVWLLLGLQAAAQAAPKSIKVSAVVSETGKFAALANQAKNAYQIYVDKVNDEGGVYVKKYGKKMPIELRIYDDESDGVKTQAQLEAANTWGAVANLGGIGCMSFELGTPIAEKNKMVWIGPGCGGWMPHQLGNEWLFSTFFKTPFFSPLGYPMVLSMPEPRPKKVAIFEINEMDCNEAAFYWKAGAREHGFEIVFHEKYPAGTKDFSALIMGAKGAGAEILLAYPLPPVAPAIVKQMKELDFSPKLVYWQRAPMTTSFAKALGPLADYVVFSADWSNQLRLPGVDYLNAKYMERHGKPAEVITGPGYAAAQVLVDAIERAGNLDREAIRDAVKATDMETVQGRIKFSPQGWAEDHLILMIQWMGGEQNIVYYNEPGEKYKDMIPKKAFKWQPKWSER